MFLSFLFGCSHSALATKARNFVSSSLSRCCSVLLLLGFDRSLLFSLSVFAFPTPYAQVSGCMGLRKGREREGANHTNQASEPPESPACGRCPPSPCPLPYGLLYMRPLVSRFPIPFLFRSRRSWPFFKKKSGAGACFHLSRPVSSPQPPSSPLRLHNLLLVLES